jgi:hypothetical protein
MSVVFGVFVSAVLTTGLSAPGDALAEESPIEITGFADFYHLFEGARNSSGFGQIEFDFEKGLQKGISVSAAIAFNPEDYLFESGAFEIDLCIIGEEGGSFYQKDGIDAMGVVVGQFDVPFGIDYLVYPSIDRWMVRGPLAVGEIHDSWNDYGLKAYLETKFVKGVLFTTNSGDFEYEYIDYTDADDSLRTMQSQRSIGGRIGIVPNDMIEVGASFAGFFSVANEVAMTMLGADLQFNYEDLHIKGEYISKESGVDTGLFSLTQDGFYVQGLYDFGKVFAFGRYGMYSSGEENTEDLKRVCIGGGWKIVEGCQARLEYQTWLDNDDASDALYLQTVVGF